jgi:hypothetical protein
MVCETDSAMTEQNEAWSAPERYPATRVEPLSVLWRVLGAPQTLLVLLGLLALSLALATLIPQIPAQAAENAEAWLATQSGLLGRGDGLIRTLGLYDMSDAIWLRLLLAFGSLVLFVRLIDSVEVAWHGTRDALPRAARLAEASMGWRANREGSSADLIASWGSRLLRFEVQVRLPVADALDRVCAFLEDRAYRCRRVAGHSSATVVAGRRPLALWGWPLAYGGLLMALVGLAVLDNWGWHSNEWRPRLGDEMAIGHGTAYVIRLDAFDVPMGIAGWQAKNTQPEKARPSVTWLRDGMEVGGYELRSGRPATKQGVSVRQVGYVPAVTLSGHDSAGRSLTLQAPGEEFGAPASLEVVFASLEEQPFVYASSLDVFLSLTYEHDCRGEEPALYVAVVSDGGLQRESLGVVHGSGTLQFADMTLAVNVGYRPVLRIDYAPGQYAVMGGFALAMLAVILVWLMPPRLVWVQAGSHMLLDAPDEYDTRVEITAPPQVCGTHWFAGLAAALSETLGACT